MYKRTTCAMLAFLMLTMVFLPCIPLASAAPNPADTHGPVNWNGDWTVTDTASYTAGTAINMLNGNIRVTATGNLSFNAAGVFFYPAADGAKGITVEAGGVLTITNMGGFTSGTAPNTFYVKFLKDSTIKLDHAGISYMGGNGNQPPDTGIYVGTKNATIEFSAFAMNHAQGDMLVIDAPITIRNNTFNTYNNYGVLARKDITLYDNTFDTSNPGGNVGGLRTDDYTKVKATNNKFQYFTSNGISVGNFASLEARTNRIHNSTGAGISTSMFSKIDLIDNDINDDGLGINLNVGSSATLKGKNRIINSKGYGIYMQSMSSMDSTGTYIKNSAQTNLYTMNAKVTFNKGALIQPGNPFNTQLLSRSTVTMDSTIISGSPTQLVLLATDTTTLDMKKCTVDGGNQNNVLVSGNGANLDIQDSTITNARVALMASADGRLASKNNTFSDFGLPFLSIFGGKLTSRNDKGSSVRNNAGVFESIYEGTLDVNNADFQLSGTDSVIGLAGYSSKARVFDSNFDLPNMAASYATIYDGRILAINSTGTPDMAMSQFKGVIDIGWHTDVLTQWQNGAAAPMADVEYNDTGGVVTGKLKTDVNGAGRMDVIDTTVTDAGITYHNFYNVTGALNGMAGLTNINISTNMIGAKAIVVKLSDSSMPFINITSPADNLLTNGTKLDVTGSVSDLGSGIAKVEIQLGTGSWIDIPDHAGGIYRVTGVDLAEDDQDYLVRVTDIAGNMATAKHNITVDWTSPPLTIDEPSGLYLTNGTFNLTGTTEAGATVTVDGMPATNTAGDWSIPMTLAEGTHTITVEAQDPAGNVAKATKDLIIDSVPPALTCDIADGTWTNLTAFVLTGTTDGISVNVSGTLAALDPLTKTWKLAVTLTEGANKFTVQASDLAGNKVKLEVTVNLDTHTPIIKVTSPNATATIYTNKANMTISGKVTYATGLFVNGQAVQFNADGNFTATVDLKVGQNTIVIKAEKKGQCFPADSYFDIFLEVYRTPPKITIISPNNGLVTNAQNVDVTVEVENNATQPDVIYGVAPAMLRIRMRNDQPTRYKATVPLSPGENTMYIVGTDKYGNTANVSLKVTQDLTSQLTVTSPKKLKVTVTSDTVSIAGTAEKGAVVTINDMAIPVDGNGAFNVKYTLKEAKNTLNVKSVDPAGNPATQTLTVTYTDSKQYELGMLLGLGIVLMIVGLVVGLVVGRAMAKPKAPPPVEQETEEAAPARSFTPEEEPEEEPAPEPKETPKPEPKEEPKPVERPKEEPKPKTDTDKNLDDLLKNLEK